MSLEEREERRKDGVRRGTKEILQTKERTKEAGRGREGATRAPESSSFPYCQLRRMCYVVCIHPTDTIRTPITMIYRIYSCARDTRYYYKTSSTLNAEY